MSERRKKRDELETGRRSERASSRESGWKGEGKGIGKK